jgi:hypothetical protein
MDSNQGGSSPYATIKLAIDSAVEVKHPIEQLIMDAESNPGAAFTPENLKFLHALKSSDRSAYESLLPRLKKLGVRISEIEKQPQSGNQDSKGDMSPADLLMFISLQDHIFCSSESVGYAGVNENGCSAVYRIKSSGYRDSLSRRYSYKTKKAPSQEALQQVVNAIDAEAKVSEDVINIFNRVGFHEDRVYVDRGSPDWATIVVDGMGWTIQSDIPIRFYRAAGSKALPVPIHGGSINELRKFLNLEREEDFILLIAWMIAALSGCGPFPPLVVLGEQGSAKSTFCRILKSLIDPNQAPIRALPRDERDILIAAQNSWVMAFDNVSYVPNWLSDLFCRIATGAGFATRKLYTDSDEVIFQSMNPIILNGIGDFVTRGDLADRSLFIKLKPIDPTHRRLEKEIYKEFEAAAPSIFGALLTITSHMLGNFNHVKLINLPRMADFAKIGVALETANWTAGSFERAYNENRLAASSMVVNADPFATAILDLMSTRDTWTGIATSLLEVLGASVGPNVTRSKLWPSIPNKVKDACIRIKPVLRDGGIEIYDHRRDHGGRTIYEIAHSATRPKQMDDLGNTHLGNELPKATDQDAFSSGVHDADDADDADDDFLTSGDDEENGNPRWEDKI